MAIQDPDPERRNLLVTSLAFVMYYLAGGHVADNNVRVQIVNITFDNKLALAVFAWVMLLWFAFRYWQTRESTFFHSFLAEVVHEKNHKLFSWYLLRQYDWSDKERLQIYSMCLNLWTRTINYEYKYTESTPSPGVRAQTKAENNQRAKLNTPSGLLIIVFFVIKNIIKKPSFASIAVPYLLFYAAVTLGLYHSVIPGIMQALF